MFIQQQERAFDSQSQELTGLREQSEHPCSPDIPQLLKAQQTIDELKNAVDNLTQLTGAQRSTIKVLGPKSLSLLTTKFSLPRLLPLGCFQHLITIVLMKPFGTK